jgi:hypothetical protein
MPGGRLMRLLCSRDRPERHSSAVSDWFIGVMPPGLSALLGRDVADVTEAAPS